MHLKRTRKQTKQGMKEYLSLVENRREAGSVKQKHILSLGCTDDIDEREIDKMILGLSKLTKNLSILEGTTDDPDIAIHASRNLGVPLVINHFWKKLGMKQLTDMIRKKHPQLRFDFDLTFRSAIIYRLITPGSERGMLDWFQDVHLPGTQKISLQHLYRSVALVAEHQEEIEAHLFHQSRNLFGMDCSLVFYDTTTTYFEGDGIDDDALKQYGYSKDHRPDRKQVKVGIVMSRDGIPVCPQVFAGNESDVTTIPAVLRKLNTLQEERNIDHLIFVGDSGMMSKDNRQSILDEGMDYILGARMRNAAAIHSAVVPVAAVLKNEKTQMAYRIKDNLFVTDTVQNEKRYILCYNPQEAEKDRKTREDIIARLREGITTSPKKYCKHKLLKRFLKITDATVTVDEKKVEEEAQYDGLFVIETNTDLPAGEVACRYKDLLLVEQAFRCLKSTLDIRPIYHQCSDNIRGHIFISYLSLYFFCLLLKELTKDDAPLPCEQKQIIPSLSRLMAHDVETHGQQFIIRSEINALNRDLLASLSLQTPQKGLKRGWFL